MTFSADHALPNARRRSQVDFVTATATASGWGFPARLLTAVSLAALCGASSMSENGFTNPESPGVSFVTPNEAEALAAQPGPIAPGTRAGQEHTNGLGMKLCWCPPGRFVMGSPMNEPEREQNEKPVNVTLTRGFWIGKFEVTQGEWQKVTGANPSFFRKNGRGGNRADAPDPSRLPVEMITYEDALEFCRKLTEREKAAGLLNAGWEYRLPTEAQWEYACRAGSPTATAFGNSLGSAKANVNGDRPYNGATKGLFLGKTTPVGSYPKNAWGLHDMHGNVYERCLDAYQVELPGGDDPVVGLNAVALDKVNRGGSWSNFARNARSAYRSAAKPDYRSDDLGLRVALVPADAP